MGWKYICMKCGTDKYEDMEYLGHDKWFCKKCNCEVEVREYMIPSPYERTRSAVYATGNRWAIENFNATHN